MNEISATDVNNYLKAFLENPSSPHWNIRIVIVYMVLVGFWEVLDAWVENVKGSADEFEIRALASVTRDLDKLQPELARVDASMRAAMSGVIPALGSISLISQSVVTPMVGMGAWSIAFRLASLRNQLVASGLQPSSGASILTSQGIAEALPQWSQPIPDWFSDLFLSSASKAIVATEKSAPGEPPTARDISETVVKEFAEKGKAAIKGVAEKISKVATPWLTMALVGGLLYLAKK